MDNDGDNETQTCPECGKAYVITLCLETSFFTRPRTRVVNRRTDSFEVSIGRDGPFGNPFPLASGAGEEARAACIEKFRVWFYAPEQAGLRKDAKAELTGKVLGCWCKPLACHGDVLVAFLERE